MKILLVNYRFYHSGGPEQYMFNVMDLLKTEGHEVIPFSVRSSKNYPCQFESYFPWGKDREGADSYQSIKKTPASAIRMASCAFFNREAYVNLRRLIQDERPEVAYVLQQVNALSPSVFKACKDEGLRVVHRLSDFNLVCPRFDCLRSGEVCTACIFGDYSEAVRNRCCHGSRVATMVRVASMKYHKARRLFDCVDAFVCPTANTARLMQCSGIDASKIAVIPTFVPPASYIKQKTIRIGSNYALYLGRISPEKGVADLIDAVIESPSVSLKVAGAVDGPYASSLISRVSDAGCLDKIQFTGPVQGEEKEELLSGSACVCCPSKWLENMPNVVLEAYAHAKPVVAYGIGCMSELVRDGKTGIVVQPGDIKALAGAVERLCNDQNLALDYGERGLSLSRTDYSPRTHLDRLLRVLKG